MSAASPDGAPRSLPDLERAAAGAGTSVGARLARALGVVVVLLLLVGVSGAGGLLTTGRTQDREVQLRRLEAANAALQLALSDADAALHDYRATGQDALLGTYTRTAATLPALHERAAALVTDPLQASLLGEQRTLTDQWLRTSEQTGGGTPKEAGARAQQAARLLTGARDANSRLDVLVQHQRDEASSVQRLVRRGALAGTALTVLAALAVVVRTGTRTRRALVDPLQRLVVVLDALGRGERGARADPRDGPREVRSVVLAVNDLARENQRLLDEAGRSARLQRLAGEIGREIRDQIVAEDALRVAVQRLGEELAVDRVWVRMLGEGGLGPVVREWAGPPLTPMPQVLRGSAPEASRSWVHELHAGGDVCAIPDTRVLRGPGAVLDGLLRGSAARAVLMVPIGVGETPHGLLSVVCGRGPREWSEHEVDLARSVAVDLARALVLAGLYRAQERLLGELRDVESVKSDLLATVSHELRTPLTSMSGYLDLLRDGSCGPVSDDVAGVLTVIARNTDRLTALIEDLLLLSRVEAAPAAEARGSTSLADLVRGALAAAASSATSGGTLRCTTPEEELHPWRVHGDAEHLHRALLSVLDNAVKFSPAGSVVRVRVETTREEARIVVADNGMGIPDGELASVFGRFARGSNATAGAVPGTGLGLTIARDLVRLHGGRISLDSAQGQGTTAVVHLPLTDAQPGTTQGGTTQGGTTQPAAGEVAREQLVAGAGTGAGAAPGGSAA